MRLGVIEAGGTKMVCAIGDEQGTILERHEIPTQLPEETVAAMIRYFADREIDALGIASFGPVDLNPQSATYGYILETPKAGWRNYDFRGAFARALGVPIGFDTDVNGAVLGEAMYGAAKGCDNAIYITVGTGIGVGVYLNEKLLHGLMHPEAGHILIPRHERDSYMGRCPYHHDCLEGLASGPALEERWGKPARELTDCSDVWELEAFYLGQAIANFVMTYSPEKVILGGGVMHQTQLYPLVREQTAKALNAYIAKQELTEGIDDYIIAPALGDNAGIVGACKLAELALG